MRVGAPLPGYAKLAAALAVGLVTIGGPSLASAATRAARDGAGCRAVCYGFYSRMLGSQVTMSVSEPGTVPGAQAGRSVILRQRAARGPAGDFTFSLVARVADFCGTDPADFFASGSYLCAHDFAFEVFEVEWVPYGDESGLCAGVAAGGQVGESVTLRPCGVSVRTLWIASKAHAIGGACGRAGNYCQWMSGADHNFRTPLVLTVDATGNDPWGRLRLAQENLVPGGGGRAVPAQEFAIDPPGKR